MNLTGRAIRLAHRDVRWSFERSGQSYAGKITVELPIAHPWHTGTILVEVTVEDTFDEARRDAYVYPHDLPLPDDWPFTWRVDVLPDSTRCLQPGKSALVDTFIDIPLSTAVNIRIFCLFGVKVSAVAKVPGDKEKTLGPAGLWGDFFNVNIIVDKLARPECLPVEGSPPHGPTLHPVHPVSLMEGNTDLARVTRFMVRHMRSGVLIQHIATGASVVLRNLKPWQADTGYSYYFNPEPRRITQDGNLLYDDYLHLRVTKGIDIRFLPPTAVAWDAVHPVEGTLVFRDSEALWSFFADPIRWEALQATEPGVIDGASGGVVDVPDATALGAAEEDVLREMPEARFFRVERVGLDEIAPFGVPFSIGAADDEAIDAFDGYRQPPPDKADLNAIGAGLGLAALDMTVSLIPVIGDAVDAGEFAWAIVTGCDRTGRPVNGWQLALLGLQIVPVLGYYAKRGRY